MSKPTNGGAYKGIPLSQYFANKQIAPGGSTTTLVGTSGTRTSHRITQGPQTNKATIVPGDTKTSK